LAFARIWPHLSACEAEKSTDPQVRQVLMDQVRHLSLSGQLAEAELIARNLLDIWSEQSGDGDRTVLRLRFLLANVLRNVGRAQEAYEIDTDVAEKQRTILPTNHPNGSTPWPVSVPTCEPWAASVTLWRSTSNATR